MLIYKITNKINNKIYIGKTVQTIKKRWNNHIWSAEHNRDKMILHSAIRKYGKDNFIIECLACVLNHKDIDEIERYFNKIYNARDLNIGYNLAIGGEGGITSTFSEERRNKLSIRFKGENNPMFGKKWSEERKSEYSKNYSGINSPTYGRKIPQYQKDIISVKNSKKVKAINSSTGEEIFFDSIKTASTYFGTTICCISKALNSFKEYGKNYKSQGHFWFYLDELNAS